MNPSYPTYPYPPPTWGGQDPSQPGWPGLQPQAPDPRRPCVYCGMVQDPAALTCWGCGKNPSGEQPTSSGAPPYYPYYGYQTQP